MKTKTVVVGMSGGVDSSVAAYLLQKQGYDVIGLFMKNWDEKDDAFCPAEKDYQDVLSICQQLSIPCYSINFTEEYQKRVFQHFLNGYAQGITPNPDILCNKEIKFKLFFEKALALGADYMATGHYCRTHLGELFKGKDQNKDQSYFLYTLQHHVLQKVLFPLGDLQKSEVKKIAADNHFCNSTKKESMGICFIGKKEFRPFLSRYLQQKKGKILTLEGDIVGEHIGCSFYTLGQRKGLKIGGKGDAWFVAKKDIFNNILYVVQGNNHPALFCQSLIADDITWIKEEITQPNFLCHAKVRYRQEDKSCIIEKIEKGQIFVHFPIPQRAVTPGQSIVFYQKEKCLGGAIIKKTFP